MNITFKSKIVDFVKFINADKYHMGIGGIGDLLLSLAGCFHEKEPRLVFWAITGFPDVSRLFIEAFGIKNYYLMSAIPRRGIGLILFNACYDNSNLVRKPVQPRGLDYDDWSRDTQKYTSRIVNCIDLRGRFGMLDCYKDKKLVCIAPRGSNVNKTISKDQFSKLITKYTNDGWQVIGVGSRSDMDLYGEGCNWVSSEFTRIENKLTAIDVRTMFQILNSCTLVVSVDSWLKTYTCLAGIKTLVLRPNTMPDGGSRIFLDQNIWKSMTLTTIEKILSESLDTCSQTPVPITQQQLLVVRGTPGY